MELYRFLCLCSSRSSSRSGFNRSKCFFCWCSGRNFVGVVAESGFNRSVSVVGSFVGAVEVGAVAIGAVVGSFVAEAVGAVVRAVPIGAVAGFLVGGVVVAVPSERLLVPLSLQFQLEQLLVPSLVQ